jgi:hypothetical protein
LWVILKLDDVIPAIIASHQMALRAAAHAPDMLYGEHHGLAC